MFAPRVLPSVLDSDEVRYSTTYLSRLVKFIAIIHLWAGVGDVGGGGGGAVLQVALCTRK